MSPLRKDAKPEIYYDQSGNFRTSCVHTNETALKYIDWYLDKKSERIDSVYAFVTSAVASKDFDNFCRIFVYKDYPINAIPFDEKSVFTGSFKSIGEMFDALQKKYPVEQNKVTIHLDFTGGFRHANVLMLVLLKLLQYAGYELGCITYTNYSEHIIENVRELVELYTLIGGASEFAENGNVFQLQKYFKLVEGKSADLEHLLKQMESFSEQIKVSTNRDYLLETINELDRAIQGYKRHLLNPVEGKISEQEHLFVKMLPMIEKDYAGILHYHDKLDSIPVLIKWCVEKGLLQQAITFCTEWLPGYIMDKGFIIINNHDIEKVCSSKNIWSDWRIEFLKNYQEERANVSERSVLGTSMAKSLKDAGLIKLNYTMIKDLSVSNESILEIKEIYGHINEKLDNLLEEISAFKSRSEDSAAGWYKYYNRLTENNGIKYFIREGCPSNNNIERFLSKRYTNVEGCFDKFFFRLLGSISKEKVCQFFGIEVSGKNNNTTAANKKFRFEYLMELEQKRSITFFVPTELLAPLVNNYVKITEVRNHLNHANHIESGREENLSLKEQILEELKLLTKCEKQLEISKKI